MNKYEAFSPSALKYKVLVLDHDDTTVKSSAEINYPAFLETLRQLRPDLKYTYDEFQEVCSNPGFKQLCLYILSLNDEEMDKEVDIWLDFVRKKIPSAFDGLDEIIKAQKALGGYVYVVSHSVEEIISRDWEANFGMQPDGIYGWDAGERLRKPSPEPIFEIREKVGCGLEDIIVVDDLRPGLEMAKAADVDFAAALWGNSTPSILKYMTENSEIVFKTVEEMRRFLFL